MPQILNQLFDFHKLFWLAAAAFLLVAACGDAGAQQASDEALESSDRTLLANELKKLNQPRVVNHEAYAGTPFGIGRISFRLLPGDEIVLSTGATLVRESSGRLLYPVLAQSGINRVLGMITGNSQAEPDHLHTVWFLFTGDQPLQVTIEGTGQTSVTVPVSQAKPNKFARFVRRWWKQYTTVTSKQAEEGDYPSVVETYLTSMLQRRMNLEGVSEETSNRDPLARTFELLFDVESLRNEEIRRSMAGGADNEIAGLPVPAGIQWTPIEEGRLPADLEIEPVANSIPEECFYFRFGTWQNQVWLKRLMEEYGGDLGRMITVRGHRPQLQSKFLNQLAIQSTEFDQLFGGKLISDVAVIGSDLYVAEGVSIGVLLYASRTRELNRNLLNKRKSFAREHASDGVTLTEQQYRGHSIQRLSAPDNRYRSFYATVGDAHLMTTSEALAKRFVDASMGERNLANCAEFRYARYLMPLSREDTVFIFLSTHFFKQMLTPRYQIELRRRNRIISDMQMLDIAAVAAQREGYSTERMDTLIQHGFLPMGFGQRPDQSQFLIKDGTWHDSLRGRRGFFTPIPDMDISAVTADESAWYHQRANFFAQSIGSLDPMMIAIKRYEKDKNVERVVFDARLAPFGEEKYGWLMSRLGEPLKYEIASSPDDLINLQASIRGTGSGLQASNHQIFAAVQSDLDQSVDLRPTTALRLFQLLREAPAYIGGWPSPGFLDFLPRLGGDPDAEGYTYSRFLNLWRLRWQDYSVIAVDRNRLETLKPHLRVEDTERTAQIRLKVGDLSQSGLNSWANSVSYRRSWQASIANTKLMHLLVQQFNLQPETAKHLAERMLNATLVCSLGGEYALFDLASGRPIWGSTAWPSFVAPELPADYRSPFLNWFRGAELEVTKTRFQFSLHGFLDIERKASDSMIPLPSLEMFKGFGNMFSSGSEKESPSPEKRQPDQKR